MTRALLALLALTVSATGSARAGRPQASGRDLQPVSREVYLMGTRAMLTTLDSERPRALRRLETLLQAVERTEAQLSTWRAGSEVSRLNAAAGAGPQALSSSMCALLSAVDRWTRETAGAFDPAIGALIAAWDVHGRGRVPSTGELASARRRSGWNAVRFDSSACTIELPPGVSLDVGGFGKGEAIDRTRRAADGDAPWLVDLGGQLAAGGRTRPHGLWNVAIARPQQRHRSAISLTLQEGSLATSAGSERDLSVDGRRIGHILDPRTGTPAPFAGSVTAWHQQGLAADVLSTALYVMGPERGMRWARTRGIAALFLVPDEEGRVTMRATPAFEARFPYRKGLSSPQVSILDP